MKLTAGRRSFSRIVESTANSCQCRVVNRTEVQVCACRLVHTTHFATGYTLRFPRVDRVRDPDDKNWEGVNTLQDVLVCVCVCVCVCNSSGF